MITIRPMSLRDVPLGLKLTNQAGWNQTEADWRRFLALQPDGCFVAELDAQPVGTVTTCTLGKVGWIGMVLVDERSRRRGVGRALVNHAIAYLEDHAVTSIRLDATSLGEPLYRTLDFAVQYQLKRFLGMVEGPAADTHPAIARPERWAELIALDKSIVGYDRRRLLLRLLEDAKNNTFVDCSDGVLQGYVVMRPGRLGIHIGPCMASTAVAGRSLLTQALNLQRGQPVIVDVPDSNARAVDTVTSRGLQPVRRFVRMCRGIHVVEQLDQLWASSGPEKG